MRRVAALLTVVSALAVAVPQAAAEPPASVVYDPPVPGPVADPFRSPPTPYAAGNRGLDFATRPGEPVRASAGGEVTFAGQVGGTLHVVVLHPDGVRTSYSFLQSVGVRRGDRVVAGDVVGSAASLLHFGARAGDVYLDPALLLDGGPPVVHLVPVELRAPLSEAGERSMLAGALRAAGRLAAGGMAATADGVVWARDAAFAAAADIADAVGPELERWATRMRAVAHYAVALRPERFAWSVVDTWWDRYRRPCTAGDVTAPPPTGRRILVLVGGIGSSGGHADVLDVDAVALGYDGDDVVQFSYRGGVVPGIGALTGVTARDYDAVDSQGDLPAAAARLRALLGEIAAAHDGVPVDVIAHSQGGVVARLALAHAGATPVESLVTLGSPHRGADLATALQLAGTTATGRAAMDVAGLATDLEGDSPAAGQLAETSDLMRGLGGDPPPPGVRMTSISARGDLVVPAPRSEVDGATNVTVPLAGVTAHSDLPGSDVAHREIELALAGMPPGCESGWDVLGDAVLSEGIGFGEDAGGALLGAGLLVADNVPGVPLAAGAAAAVVED